MRGACMLSWLLAALVFVPCVNRARSAALSSAARTASSSTTWTSIFPEYTYKQHPLLKFPEFAASRPAPVIMKKYYHSIDDNGGRRTYTMRFLPSIATYKYQSDQIALPALDALTMRSIRPFTELDNDIIEMHLNGPARVVFLLDGNWRFRRMLRGGLDNPSVTGLKGWENPKVVELVPSSTRLDGARLDGAQYLPNIALALERSYNASETVRIPSLKNVKVNDMKPNRLAFLFAQEGHGPLKAFSAPSVPSQAAVQALVETDAPLTVPQPNKRCPAWLHDIHVVKSLDATGPRTWRTWHPAIDSVYWCYYGHEHGAFPGKFSPAFGYTAYHTEDENTADRRQDESHNGFKVYSWAVKDRIAVTATLHAHLSRARRFSAREHTVIFSAHKVDQDGEWTKLVLLHMKMDFGAAQVREVPKLDRAANEVQQLIQDEMDAAAVIVGRRFNVFNDTLNTGDGQLSTDSYEKWKGLLNSCSFNDQKSRGNSFGFDFNIINPPNGMGDVEEPLDNLVESSRPLQDDGLRRRLILLDGGFRVGYKYCEFNETKAPFQLDDGSFFTDTKFHHIESGEGDGHARQFIKDTSVDVLVEPGRVFMSDYWPSHMQYTTALADQITTLNTEGAVDVSDN